VGVLDVVQEFRQLTSQEFLLRRDLKARILGLSAVQKIRAKQQSRLTMIRAENANSKLFYMRINGKKRKNFIQKLHSEHGVAIGHKEKENLIHDHFSRLFGAPSQRQFTLDWDQLGLQQVDLRSLEDDFTEDEVHAVVKERGTEKATRVGGEWEPIKNLAKESSACNPKFTPNPQVLGEV